jgi:hypothetical protein
MLQLLAALLDIINIIDVVQLLQYELKACQIVLQKFETILDMPNIWVSHHYLLYLDGKTLLYEL